jgi:hypothetical protein
VEWADEGLVFEEERVHARGKANQGFLPIDALVQLDSSVKLALLDEILDELFQNLIGIFEKDDFIYSRHARFPFRLLIRLPWT